MHNHARFARAWYTGYLYTVLHPRISQGHSKHPTVRQSNLVLKQIGTLWMYFLDFPYTMFFRVLRFPHTMPQKCNKGVHCIWLPVAELFESGRHHVIKTFFIAASLCSNNEVFLYVGSLAWKNQEGKTTRIVKFLEILICPVPLSMF